LQEPDTAASAAQALISLLVEEEPYFPLGFAYGHLRDAAVSVFDLAGRGFANQEILEELAARKEMSNQVGQGGFEVHGRKCTAGEAACGVMGGGARWDMLEELAARKEMSNQEGRSGLRWGGVGRRPGRAG